MSASAEKTAELLTMGALEVLKTSAKVAALVEHVRWCAQTVHQAHHAGLHDDTVEWRECARGFCVSCRQALREVGVVP